MHSFFLFFLVGRFKWEKRQGKKKTQTGKKNKLFKKMQHCNMFKDVRSQTVVGIES